MNSTSLKIFSILTKLFNLYNYKYKCIMFCIKTDEVYDLYKKKCVKKNTASTRIYMKKLEFCSKMHNKNLKKCKIINKFLRKKKIIKNIIIAALISFTLALLYTPIKGFFLKRFISNTSKVVKQKTGIVIGDSLEGISKNMEKIKNIVTTSDSAIKSLKNIFETVIENPMNTAKNYAKSTANYANVIGTELYDKTGAVLEPVYSSLAQEIINKNKEEEKIPGSFPEQSEDEFHDAQEYFNSKNNSKSNSKRLIF